MASWLPESWPGSNADARGGALQAAIAGETARSLGQSAAKVERALEDLCRYEGPPEGRQRALRAAIDAVYHYFIQRELVGLYRHDEVIEHYHIPQEVLVRLGSV